MADKFSIAVLAGGKSSRMGGDKAMLRLGGRPLIAHLVDVLGPLTDDFFIAGGDVASIQELGLPVCADQYDFKASIVGVYSALAAARNRSCFVTACDMPFAAPELIGHMSRMTDGCDAVVPVSHRGLEPLHAFYSRACLEPMRRSIEQGDLAIRSPLRQLRVRYVEAEKMNAVCDVTKVFTNINTPADLEEAERILTEVPSPGAYGRIGGGEVAPTRRAAGYPPLVCFVGKKNSGKTAFVEKLVPALALRGIKAAFIKHDVHGFTADREGTDTWRLSQAGASPVIISAPGAVASFSRVDGETGLEELCRRIDGEPDIVIVEGFKSSGADRIEISRSARSRELACREQDLIAVVSDRPGTAGVKSFGLDDVEAVASFLISRYGL